MSLGGESQEFLLNRLTEGEHEPYYYATVVRLTRDGGHDKNPQLARGFRKFVDLQLPREAKALPGTTNAVKDAIEAIGFFGAQDDVEYLAQLIGLKEESTKVNLHDSRYPPEKIRFYVRQYAVKGLGWSGNATALRYLKQLKNSPPSSMYPKDFLAVIEQSIEVNESIQKIGVARYFSDEERAKRQKAFRDEFKEVLERRRQRRLQRREERK